MTQPAVATATSVPGIVMFSPQYAADFRRLNVAWLTRYFKVEPIDELVLGNPQEQIIDRGGEILFAILDGEVVGTVGLKAEDATTVELTKMAVDERYQGRGFGRLLLSSALDVARQRGCKKVILYSQVALAAAVTMYRSAGFTEVPLGNDARYSRCDVKMEYSLG